MQQIFSKVTSCGKEMNAEELQDTSLRISILYIEQRSGSGELNVIGFWQEKFRELSLYLLGNVIHLPKLHVPIKPSCYACGHLGYAMWQREDFIL